MSPFENVVDCRLHIIDDDSLVSATSVKSNIVGKQTELAGCVTANNQVINVNEEQKGENNLS